MANRFIAGETRSAAIQAVRQLNQQGILATLDHLGENTSSVEAARQAAVEVCEILEDINRQQVKSNVSIKLSQIGLTVDEAICQENLIKILATAKKLATFIRIDMEDSTLTEKTIQMVLWASRQGFTNVGIVIQSYLRRSEADILTLREVPIPVRLCKGAYQEPAQIAFPLKSDVDRNYDHLLELLVAGSLAKGSPSGSEDGRIPPLVALATHDKNRVLFAKAHMDKLNVPRQAVEFQLLYGIRRDLQEQLAGEGYSVRVYVPYGTHWYPYFMRRLAERPANIWFFVSNFLRR